MRRAVAGAAVVLLLSACASAPDRVHTALDSASSATASVSIVLEALDAGEALPTFADTVIGDALTELEGATSDLTQAGPVGEAAPQRDAALISIDRATDAVLAARETVASGGNLSSDIAAVDAATDDLRDRS